MWTFPDPGTSGLLTPFCKTDGLFFNGANEPQEFKCLFEKEVTDFRRLNEPNNLFVSLDYENGDGYLESINSIRKVTNNFKVVTKDNEKSGLMIIRIR